MKKGKKRKLGNFVDLDERELVSEEAWNSRPGVYTDEEFAEELRLSEESGYLTEEEVKMEFARCGVMEL